MKFKPTISIDFDGVIHDYLNGWKGIDVIDGKPVKGAFDALEEYTKYFKVHIFSTRNAEPKGIHAMIEWFIENNFKYTDQLIFPLNKPPALVSIDDRGIQFNGIFPTIEEIKNFKVWYK